MKILLVDDHYLFREGLASLLKSHPDIEIIGEANSVQQAIEVATRLDPDVILMDFGLPDGTGLDAVQAILAQKPRIRIVFLTVHDESEALFAALRSGASGYLLKDLPMNKLVAALRGMEAGEMPLSRRMTTTVVHEFSRLALPEEPDHTILSRLTLREMEILQELATGYLNQEIAARLSLSETTVKNHVHSILHKLGLHNRREAAQFAREHGLGNSH